MKNIIKRIGFIGSLIFLVGLGATSAFFSDSENSVGNVLAAGGIDLQIDNDSWYNGVHQPQLSWELKDLTDELFFNFLDLKPGDWEEDTISFHVNDNDHWLCAEVALTGSNENDINEPEIEAGDVTSGAWEGELDDELHFVFWADDGDNVLEHDEEIVLSGSPSALPQDPGAPVTFAVADSSGNIYDETTNPLPGESEYFIGKAFCYGDMTLTPLTQDGSGTLINPGGVGGPGFTCDGSLVSNMSQTDSLRGDISFTAVQSRDLPDFVCGQPLACVDTYATISFENNQGTRKDGGAILANRTNPSAMFGPPETSGADSDVGFPAGSFFSLGFYLDQVVPGEHGNIVLGFDAPFYPNPLGPDLKIFEVTGGVYPDEKVKVEVSPTGLAGSWTLVAAAATRDEDLELPGSVTSAQYVRLTDVSDISLFPDDADAYDVDAVKATCGTEPQV